MILTLKTNFKKLKIIFLLNLKIPLSIAANTNPNRYPIVGPTKYTIPKPFSGVPEKTGNPIIPSNK